MAALVPTILELEELVKKWRAMAAEAEARGMELVEVEDESEFLGAVKGRVSTRAAKDTVIIRDETHRDGALRHKRIKLKSDADEGKGGSADDSGGQTGRMAARGRTASGGVVGGGRMGSSQEGRMSSPLPSSSSSKAESNSESEMEADDMQLTWCVPYFAFYVEMLPVQHTTHNFDRPCNVNLNPHSTFLDLESDLLSLHHGPPNRIERRLEPLSQSQRGEYSSKQQRYQSAQRTSVHRVPAVLLHDRGHVQRLRRRRAGRCRLSSAREFAVRLR